ncbi:MAG: nucleotidyltransferase domain-containing protein [Deltaproteobacteria bacterium]|nr:nucleotidyltransferase domain-containing protein [Deltaproteobacteria bacterium]
MSKALELKDAILEAYDPEAVILFGSLGRGDADEFSDVDLLVVMETDGDTKTFSEEMTRYLDRIARDKHVILRTPSEFCRQIDIPGTLVFSAAKEGRVLFEKAGWQQGHEVIEPYETRKLEVIRQGYVREAGDFLAQAGASLERGSLFRCRDLAKFAAARALKGLFVLHDMHPPRETDLVSLLEEVRVLEPGLEGHAAFLRELNEYCPNGRGTAEIRRARKMVERAAAFFEGTTGWHRSLPP